MAVLDPQAAIDAAQPYCCVPVGDLWWALLAGLIDVGEGNPVPTDVNALMAEIACLKCAIQPGDLPLLLLGAVANINAGGGGGTGGPGQVGTGSPEGVVTAPPGTSYYDDTTPGSVHVWVKMTGVGNTGWEQTL